jgi:ubiquinol-cytochrome c reductase cytochrome b/c1 subunit
MSGGPRVAFKNPVIEWVDSRLPIFTILNKEYAVFPTPRNFNYLWNFGALALVMLVVMIASGIFLAMNYNPSTAEAFNSVERIMRDVNNGWLLRYVHSNGASMFFAVVFIHIFRGLYYGSYKKPRELLWMLGVTILLLMMATAFMGYVLPWGQMSFWGATVITNLFSAIPLIGQDIVTWLWGGFSVDNPTLNRFFALHFLMPFLIVGVVFLHVVALHVTGSNNPLGIEPKGPKDTLPFHPYYTIKDSFGLTVFLIIYAGFVFYAPNYLGHPDNYVPANPMVTPAHIVPEWYFLPFYAILRAVPDKLGGVLLMFSAIGVLFALPWLDTSPVRSARFRPIYRVCFWLLLISCIALGIVGSKPAEGNWVLYGRIATAYYFLHFLVILPLLGKYEKTLPLPNSIAEAVLGKKAAIAVVLAVLTLMPLRSGHAAGAEIELPKVEWSFNGPFGEFDRTHLQRGFQVYKEVCSACHSMKLLSYRHLTQIGYTADQVKAIAAQYNVMDGPNDEGEMFERPAEPKDRFHAPFANEKAARAANNGAYPPDMSLLAKARHGGADYIHALLTGYVDAPADFKLSPGMNYNKYFAGHQIAMASPLSKGLVSYTKPDGSTYEPDVEEMSRDISSFLMWAAEPQMEERKRNGVKVILFLIVFAGIMYGVKRKIWADVHH